MIKPSTFTTRVIHVATPDVEHMQLYFVDPSRDVQLARLAGLFSRDPQIVVVADKVHLQKQGDDEWHEHQITATSNSEPLFRTKEP